MKNERRARQSADCGEEERLNQQVQYDLWHAERKRKRVGVGRFAAA